MGDQTLNVDMITRMDQTNTALGKIRTEMATLTKSIKELNAEGKKVGKVSEEFKAVTRTVAQLGGVTGEVAQMIGSATSKGMVGALGKVTAVGVAAGVVIKTITAYYDAQSIMTDRAISAQVRYGKVLDATASKMKEMAGAGSSQAVNVRKVLAAGGQSALGAMDKFAGIPGVRQDQAEEIVSNIYLRHGKNAPGVLQNAGEAIQRGGEPSNVLKTAMSFPAGPLMGSPGQTFGATLPGGLNESFQSRWNRAGQNVNDPFLLTANKMGVIEAGIAPGLRKETVSNGVLAASEKRATALNPYSAQLEYQQMMAEEIDKASKAEPTWAQSFGALRWNVMHPGDAQLQDKMMTGKKFAAQQKQEELLPGLKALERVSLMQLEVSKRVAEGLEKNRNIHGQ